VGLRSPGKVEILEGLEAGDSVVTAGQQRVQRDGTAVMVADLARARAAGPSASASAPSAATSAPGSSSGPTPSAAAAPATPTPAPVARAVVSGPNPCGAVVAELPAASKAGRSTAPPERRPAAAARDPA
jgi:membrane fusion protein (multidrug efflux system)